MKLPNFIPCRNSPLILKTISRLEIQKKPFYIDIVPEEFGINSNCFENVKLKVLQDGGELIHGWQFCELEYMIEAEFHAVWKSQHGDYVDITTPGIPEMSQALFVVDPNRSYQGLSIDNFRYNTTDNLLVDDIIEIDKWRFRFLNSGHRIHYNEEDLIGKDFKQLTIIYNWIGWLESFYYNGGNLDTICCETRLPRL